MHEAAGYGFARVFETTPVEVAQASIVPQVNVEHAGQIIAELYRLEEQLGRGAMGRIWRAKHLRLESKVAIKFIDPAIAEHPEAFNRFLREAQSAAAVRSAHVVQIFDCGMDGGVPYISMELLDGESLDKRLCARGALSASELVEIFSGVAQAVDTAHEHGVIHRDLKPGNIFIARERDVEIAKVLDFGIAKLMNGSTDVDSAAGTGTGVMLGTPYYMSPEQVRGSRSLDQRTDLWSLAVIAFECLTGELPFRGESMGDIVVQICTASPTLPSELAAVPPGFDEWFVKGTSKDPSARFATARQMAETLSEIVARSPAAVGAAVARVDATGASATLASVPVPVGVERSTPATARPGSANWAPSESASTSRSRPPVAQAAPSQSTAPMTAAIPPASERLAPRGPGRAKRRSFAMVAIALSCVISAVVLWALPQRRVGSVLHDATPAPASPAPPVEARVPTAAADALEGAGAAVEPAAVTRRAPAPDRNADVPSEPEPSQPEPSPDAADLEPPSASASVRSGPSKPHAGRRSVRSKRKHKAKKAPEIVRSLSPAGSPQRRAETDPFSERQ
jgi:serine/threonine-protein kinase